MRLKPKGKAYQTDSSEEDALSRENIASSQGMWKGIGAALQRAPREFVEGFTDLLTNPIATIEGIIEGLSNLPELSGLVFEYLDSIEGNEEEKAAEIADFITSQLVNILSPNKAKLLVRYQKAS
jgi:hypothetical protein